MSDRFRARHLNALILACSLLLGGGAAVDAQILNSERIEETFGSYGIDIIATDSDLRISNLYSIDDGNKITRTYAVVETPSRVDIAIESPHAAIQSGGSIGATFKASGWDVVKRHLYFGRAAIPAAVAGGMKIAASERVAMHAYVLDVTRQDTRHEYATIVELHHPDYLKLDELIGIYAPDGPSGREVPEGVWLMLMRAEQALDSMASPLRQ